MVNITEKEFTAFQQLIYEIAGINLSPAKKPLVCGRLTKRLQALSLKTFGDYYEFVTSGKDPNELQLAVDLLTTNETFFFREDKHFDFLRQVVLPKVEPGRAFRVWSAACSSGEEPYTIAMILMDKLGDRQWEIVASDISKRMLERAQYGQYPMERAGNIPKEYLTRYCLKGIGRQEGTFLVDQSLKKHIQFKQINLNERLPRLGEFDLIFIRNVMIYFQMETKRQIVQRMLPLLKSGGHFLVGHSESLNGIADNLIPVKPSTYRKP